MNRRQRRASERRSGRPSSVAATAAVATDVLFAEAFDHHRAGRLDEAEACYLGLLQRDAGHAESWHLLGVLAHQRGALDMAAERIGRAIELKPSAAFFASLGGVLKDMGRLDDAIACYREALAAHGDFSAALRSLGELLVAQGRAAEAVPVFERLLALGPGDVNSLFLLGLALSESGSLDAAAANLRRALELRPDFPEALCNLGDLLTRMHRHEEAVACLERAVVLAPEFPEAWFNLGNAFRDQRRLEDAARCYRRALAGRPGYADAWCNLGNVVKEKGGLGEAVACYEAAVDAAPASVAALNNLGNALRELGRLDDAIECYSRALAVAPGQAAIHSNLIFALDLSVGADTALLQVERWKWDRQHAAPLLPHPLVHANRRDPERRLRIGYVSADFRNHSAPSVFLPMLEDFDRAQFDVYAYSNSPLEDDLTRRIRGSVTAWRDIAPLADGALAEMIRDDAVDILVDLSGHSAGNRLLAFARKPAPIQVTAWGYATTTGMTAMDAFFADPVVLPPAEMALYTEQVRYLPSVVCYRSAQEFPPVSPLPALSHGGITFGSLNRLPKLNRETIAAWAAVLQAVPGSRMILKAAEFDDAAACEGIAAQFGAAGVDAARIVFAGKTPWPEHVAMFDRIDIALDPFPHGGGVTCLEGLAMGVPAVALRWPTIAGRLSASILTTLGLADWIAESVEEYVEVAVRHAARLDALAGLRQGLRSRLRASAIGEARAYVAAVEREYRALWRDWCKRPA